MRLTTTLAAFTVSVAFCRADDPLDGFRKAPLSLKSDVTAPNLLVQARLVLAKEKDPGKVRGVLNDLLDVQKASASFLHYLYGGRTLKDFLADLENARIDKQAGQGSSGAASTSIVSKPGAAAVLSAAVETGALTQTAGSGNQATFRGNVVGIAHMLMNDDIYAFCDNNKSSCDTGVVRFLKPLSFSVTVDPNGEKSVAVPVSGFATASSAAVVAPSSANLPSSSQRVAAWGVRYALRNPHVLDSKENRTAYFSGLTTAGGKLVAAIDPLFTKFTAYRTWLDKAVGHLAILPADTSQAAFEDALKKQLDELATEMRTSDKSFDTEGITAWGAYQSYYKAREDDLDGLPNANMLTVEYNHNDPANQPSISNFRFIYSRQFSNAVLITGNLTGEVYNTLPVGASVSRFRDFQAAAEVDISLKQWGQIGKPVFSIAGYFQYQHDPALLNVTSADLAPGTNIALPSGAATVLGEKGNIGIGQVKLTIPFKSTGVSFPIAVTWSNRTELIKASDVSGHVGIAFDLDSLFTQPKSK